ncbi:MAG: hypothetical protein WCV63_03950 [Negativicutes bacterium]|jgi:hypothetical protein
MTIHDIVGEIKKKYNKKNAFSEFSAADKQKYCRALIFPFIDMPELVRDRVEMHIAALLRQREIFIDSEMLRNQITTNLTAAEVEEALLLIIETNVVDDYQTDLAVLKREIPSEVMALDVIDDILATLIKVRIEEEPVREKPEKSPILVEAEQKDYFFLSSKEMLLGKEQWATCFALAHDSAELAFAVYNGEIFLWNRETAVSRRIAASNRSLLSVVFSPTGDVIAAGGEGGTLFFYSLENGELLYQIDTGLDTIYSVVYSHSGLQLAAGGRGGSVRMFTVKSGLPVKDAYCTDIYIQRNFCWKLCFSEDDKYLFIGGASGELVRYEPVLDAQNYLNYEYFEHIYALAVIQGKLMLNGNSGELLVKSVVTGKTQLARSYHGRIIVGIAVSCDQKYIATADYSGSICIWNASDVELRQVLNLNEGTLVQIDFDVFSNELILLYKNGKVKFLDLDAEEWHKVR